MTLSNAFARENLISDITEYCVWIVLLISMSMSTFATDMMERDRVCVYYKGDNDHKSHLLTQINCDYDVYR